MRTKALFRLIVEPIALAVVLAFAVRHFIRIYTIPSESMAPTLRTGDHILVTSLRSSPGRGDVVVFRAPAGDGLLIKRIVAEPGDLVESREGRLSIRGAQVREPYLPPRTVTSGIAPQIVPAGCYFVLGDNRGNSADSRSWGVLPRQLLVGRARVVLWSSRDTSSTPAARATTAADEHASSDSALRLFRTIE